MKIQKGKTQKPNKKGKKNNQNPDIPVETPEKAPPNENVPDPEEGTTLSMDDTAVLEEDSTYYYF